MKPAPELRITLAVIKSRWDVEPRNWGSDFDYEGSSKYDSELEGRQIDQP